MDDRRIDLAHEPDFAIGPLTVRPSVREVVRDDRRLVIEPRVMQVMVALARAEGGVVSKDDLALLCWEGRVVGEDAINRVLSRLRRIAEGIAAGVMRIETVTRVGYRMTRVDIPDNASLPQASAVVAPRLGRRTVLVGSAALVAALGAGGAWMVLGGDDAPPDGIAAMMARAQDAIAYGTPEQTSVGISLLQAAVSQAPTAAAAWGQLALAYGQQAQQSGSVESRRLSERAKSAATRALELDPLNADAHVVLLLGRPGNRTMLQREQDLRQGLGRYPDHRVLLTVYAVFLTQVGRDKAALSYMERALARAPLAAPAAFVYANMLWSAGRLEEADAAIDKAFEIWPRHYGVWFSRFKMLNYSGRTSQALAMLADEGRRPVGIPDSNFALSEREARALASRALPDIDAAMQSHAEAARVGVGFAQNAITFASAVGRLDTAFTFADAYFFNRGFKLGEQRYTKEQGLFSAARRRSTHFLFSPPLAAMRADARFAVLMRDLDLETYWRSAGVTPDYRA